MSVNHLGIKNKNIQEKISSLKEEIAELEHQKREFENLSPAQQVAEELHSRFCHYNHDDGCGWFYESWDNPGWSRKDYLNKARNGIAEAERLGIKIEDFFAVYDKIKGYRRA